MKDISVLVDMDGVLAETIGGFNKTWQRMFPGVPYIPYEKVTKFYLEELCPEDQKEMVSQIWASERFYFGLEPIQGALEAVEEIRSRVRDIAICTSPFSQSKTSVQEKWKWIRKYLG